jgi:hypothetical protein
MSSLLGHVLLSYDLRNRHNEVKANMSKRGYYALITLGQNPYRLPNTTLYKNNVSTDQALIDLREACLQEGATLEKAVAVIGAQWAAYDSGT